MLLHLTSKCDLECTHCMNSSNSNGINMNWNNLKLFNSIIKDLYLPMISISGSGEFTTHPEFYEMCKYLIEENPNKLSLIVFSLCLYNFFYVYTIFFFCRKSCKKKIFFLLTSFLFSKNSFFIFLVKIV